MFTDKKLGKHYNLKRDCLAGWEKPNEPALLLGLIDPGSLYIAFDTFSDPDTSSPSQAQE